MFDSIRLRDEPIPELLVVVRLGSAEAFAEVRRHFEGPVANPAWVDRSGSVR